MNWVWTSDEWNIKLISLYCSVNPWALKITERHYTSPGDNKGWLPKGHNKTYVLFDRSLASYYYMDTGKHLEESRNPLNLETFCGISSFC